MLGISNFGEVINNNFPFYFKEQIKKCEFEHECNFFYREYVFDAQQFEYVVQIQPHSYDDPSLKEGESGIHLDIYPHPYDGFRSEAYDGVYFENPIPNESGQCTP